MIFDRIENVNNYKGLGRLYTALEFMAKTDFTQIPIGKYELDGDNIYYMVQQYDTNPDKTVAEAHKKYIDIQYIEKGEEIMQRKIYKKLLEWKNNTDSIKPLMVLGARQVGKTYVINEFCEKEFKNYIHINLFQDTEIVKLYKSDKNSKDKYIELQLLMNFDFDTPNTIVFIDEIQECEELISELKELCPKGNRRMGANPVANGGQLLKELRMPDFKDYALKIDKPGSVEAQDMMELGHFVRDIVKENDDTISDDAIS